MKDIEVGEPDLAEEVIREYGYGAHRSDLLKEIPLLQTVD